jgi:uncharacterized protein
MNVLITILFILAVIYFIPLIFIGRFLAYNDLFKRKIPNKSILNGFDYEEIKFTTTEGITLRGWFIKGENNPTHRTLILLHGWHHDRERFIKHAKLFAENGFNVVIYDQRSHGESDNALITFGKGEGKDLLSCLEFLKKKDYINMSQLGAIGFSLGSGGLIYATSSTPESIFKAIILEGAYANSYDVGLFMLQNKFGKFPGYLIGVMFFTLGTKMMSFGKFHHSLPYKYIGLIKSCPIMVIRGEKDYMVPKQSSEQLINSITTTKSIWLNENGNHTDSYIVYPDEYKRRVLGFLNKYL